MGALWSPMGALMGAFLDAAFLTPRQPPPLLGPFSQIGCPKPSDLAEITNSAGRRLSSSFCQVEGLCRLLGWSVET